MEDKVNDKQRIDFIQVKKTLLGKKKLFLKVWGITFVLSCLWIFPQPRYYTTEVSIAPESADMKVGGSLASLASSFGVNMGSGSQDAIYPQLYPDLFKSTEFLVGLFDVQLKTQDGEVETDYYTYMKDLQKPNIYLVPFNKLTNWISSLLSKEEEKQQRMGGKRFDPFQLSKKTTAVLQSVSGNLKCTYSRTTDVVTIQVKDQDPLVCALMADSVMAHLQAFIVDYRTKKSRIDYEHYCKLTDDAWDAYEKARKAFAAYSDANCDVVLQSVKTKIDDLENDMQMKYHVFTALTTRKEEAFARVQENTPAFTILKNATVPVKPAGPKRMVFVALMLILATIGTVVRLLRRELVEWF